METGREPGGTAVIATSFWFLFYFSVPKKQKKKIKKD
jgi:hypothetical protein